MKRIQKKSYSDGAKTSETSRANLEVANPWNRILGKMNGQASRKLDGACQEAIEQIDAVDIEEYIKGHRCESDGE